MSAMSASSPPAGLMPLSLITEHKAPVPTPAVQPLARTPEKLAVQQPGPNPINKPPSLPNGMEPQISANPVPVAPHIQEIPHPIVALENMTPPIHYPNFPAVSKAEQPTDGPSNSSSTSSRGEESVAEAPAHQVSLQPSASVSANQAPVPQPQPQPACLPLELAEEQPVADEAEAQTARTAESSQPSGAQEGASANVELPKEAPQQEPSEPEVKPGPAEPEKNESLVLPQNRSPSPSTAEVAPTPEPKLEPAVEKEAPSAQPQSPEPAQTTSKATPRAKRPKPTATKAEKKIVKETTPVDDDKKPKRKRLPTQIYQSPIPELNLIAKISKIEKKPQKEKQDEKLIVFYKNEFLAVRNAEGGFYICQAMQNIYKSSSKIKIRWLSQENNGELYTPDFYDFTDFDCILTNLSLKRVGKDKFNLPPKESQRTQSILKRAIDVENGVAAPEDTVTEEHPDGLDLSLYRNEDQIKKKKGGKTDEEDSEEEEEEEDVKSKPIRPKRKAKKKKGKPQKVVKNEVIASTSTATTSKRKAVEPQESKAKVAKKSHVIEKKEATPPAKKETKVVKRKAVSPAASSIPEKKGKKDTNVKKNAASTTGTAKGSGTTRRTRTAK